MPKKGVLKTPNGSLMILIKQSLIKIKFLQIHLKAQIGNHLLNRK